MLAHRTTMVHQCRTPSEQRQRVTNITTSDANLVVTLVRLETMCVQVSLQGNWNIRGVCPLSSLKLYEHRASRAPDPLAEWCRWVCLCGDRLSADSRVPLPVPCLLRTIHGTLIYRSRWYWMTMFGVVFQIIFLVNKHCGNSIDNQLELLP